MNTTANAPATPLTSATLDALTEHDEWLGFGYLGERQLDRRTPAEVAAADAVVLDHANRRGLTVEQLFTWANSKDGRWFGDCMFGGTPHQAARYLPAL